MLEVGAPNNSWIVVWIWNDGRTLVKTGVQRYDNHLKEIDFGFLRDDG
jgi:hypothetical protein